MRNLRSILFLSAGLLLLTAFPTLILADTPLPVEGIDADWTPDPDASGSEIPSLDGGEPYPYPIISYEPASPALDIRPDSPTAPVINVWYGTNQSFGQPGTPQKWINILGNVSGATTLVYSLNGGPDQPLTIGTDTKDRLYSPGDFNIELDYQALNNGANSVVIKASDGVDTDQEVVTVNYSAGNAVPLPHTVSWSSLPNVLAGGQPVDGLWAIDGGRLETQAPGFDRLYAIGDMGWTDYEVTVPVTISALNTSEWTATNGAGVGLIVRWQGHVAGQVETQPLSNWRRLGALAWFRWMTNGTSGWEVRGNGGGVVVPTQNPGAIELDETYIFKLSVQSSTLAGEPATYRFKYWPEGSPEPIAWNFTSKGNTGEPASGSVVLVAHQAMVSWGDVTIEPIQDETFTVNVNQPPNGQIFVTPEKPVYQYGERVTLRAQGAPGYGLSKWTGSFNGSKVNPLVFDITENVTVGAQFVAAPQPTLTFNYSGQGTVVPSPAKQQYLYGELVTLTPQPALGYVFAGWSGDLTGADNPAAIVMDKSKTITANFVLANPDSPVSDDFHTCGLNTDVWSFVNPVGDGSYEVTANQLRLNVPGNVSHNIWQDGNKSVRMMQPTENENFEIVTKFDSAVTQRYQMQGILVEEDSDDFLRFEVHNDQTYVRVYAARFENGIPRAVIFGITLASTPPYQRVTRVDSQWSFSYSFDGQTWVSAGSFIFDLDVTSSGVFGANHGSAGRPVPPHTAIVDYFFNSASPINPEDGGVTGGFAVNKNVVGEGTVSVSPAKAAYACGETVTISANPAAGWKFAGWSGDLTGTIPSQQLVIARDHQVTATFTENPQGTTYRLFLPSVLKR